MGIMKTYNLLAPDEKLLIDEKVVSMNRPIGELLQSFRAIAEYDRLADKARTRAGCTSAVLFVLTIPALIFAANSGWPGWYLAPLLAIGGGVALVLQWKKLQKLDLSNNLRDFVVPVLTLLREDVDPTERMQLKLDLRSPLAPEKKISEQKLPVERPVTELVERIYLDKWFEAEARLATGGRVKWEIADRIRERKRTKRNPRGKYRMKTKYKKKTDIEVALALKKDQWVVEPAPASGVIVGGDERKSVIRVEREVVTDTIDPIPPAALLDALAEAWRRAKPVE